MISLFRVNADSMSNPDLEDIRVDDLYFPYEIFLLEFKGFYFEVVYRNYRDFSYRVFHLEPYPVESDWFDVKVVNPKSWFAKHVFIKDDEGITVLFARLMILMKIKSQNKMFVKCRGAKNIEPTTECEIKGKDIVSVVELCKKIGKPIATGTGTEKDPHFRRGHTRILKDGREIWVKPMKIRQDKGDPTNGHIYNV